MLEETHSSKPSFVAAGEFFLSKNGLDGALLLQKLREAGGCPPPSGHITVISMSNGIYDS